MSIKKTPFKELESKESFLCNGTLYTKQGTRTAKMHNTDRLFYFRKDELIIRVKLSESAQTADKQSQE